MTIGWSNFLILMAFIMPLVLCSRMKDQIAIEISDIKHYCFRLLNSNTTVGCQSERTGNIGALAVINEPADLTREIANLPYGISKIIAIVEIKQFNKQLIVDLQKSESVSGILLIDSNTSRPVSFSEDSVCPNDVFSVRTKTETQSCKWNEKGAIHSDGLRFLSFQKPIFLLTNKTDIDVVMNKCNNRNNNKNRRCMAKMTQFMRADGNVEICLRRQNLGMSLCDPLHDYNVFAVLPVRSWASADIKPNIFMLSTRIDSFSTFANSPGGDISALSSVIAVLAIADAIGQNLELFLKKAEKTNRQLVLAFFHGESMGYIGSSRMVWEMERNIFPLKAHNFSSADSNIRQIALSDLAVFLELQQLEAHKIFHLHSSFDVYSRNSSLLDKMADFGKQFFSSKKLGFQFHKEKTVPFPPSSFHSILKQTTRVPGALLTSYGDSYNSGFINSILDTDITSRTERRLAEKNNIIAAAEMALGVALNYVFSENSLEHKSFAIRPKYIEELVNCFFTDNWHCTLFQTLLNSTNIFTEARYLFIGTLSQESLIRALVNALLVRSLGEKWAAPNVSFQSQCNDLNKNQNVYQFVWQIDAATNQSHCYRTNIYLTNAKSPAFDEKGYNFKSDKYSTWMESVWDNHSQFELYLKSDIRLDLCAGVVAFFAVLVSVALNVLIKESWFIDSNVMPYQL